MTRAELNRPRVVRLRSPQVGVPFRTVDEETADKRAKIEPYLRAVEAAGGKPIEVSLGLSREELDRVTQTLDAIVLPGSPADVDPTRYGAARHPRTAGPDPLREQTDFALLDHAFAERKPVLAICYGMQSLNVYLGGTLVQDIPTELETKIKHDRKGLGRDEPDPRHMVRFRAEYRLGELAGTSAREVNSTHHQAVLRPGRELRVVVDAPDGVIEAVEGTGKDHWVIGVQWHPERMNDEFSVALFRTLIEAARPADASVKRI